MNINELRTLVKETVNERQRTLIEESLDYTDIMNILSGERNAINTIGIMTAQNPNGAPPPGGRAENLQRNKDFIRDLRAERLGFRHIIGKFGVEEDSLFIANISKSQIIEFGKKYQQEAVIFAQRVDDKSFDFQYIQSKSGQVMDNKTIVLPNEEIESRTDFYSAAGKGRKQRKFVIPFFEPDYNKIDTTQNVEDEL